MSNRTLWLASALVLSKAARPFLFGFLVSILGTVLLLTPAKTEAGHSLGFGTCWRSGTSYTCRYTWQYGQWMPMRLIDQVSPTYASWWDAVTNAMWGWNQPGAIGPQNFHYVPQQNDSWVYIKYAHTGQQGLTSDLWAITKNCRTDGWCSTRLEDPIIIYWSEIFGNTYTMPADWNRRKYTWAHEMGHTLGLGHHGTSGPSIMWQYSGILTPQTVDFGPNPPCISYPDFTLYGIRCIYNWSWD